MINYKLFRTEHDKFQIEVMPDCSVVVRVPEGLPKEQIDFVVDSYADKIREVQKRYERKNRPHRKDHTQ